ncbi:MAG: hypothetical protein Q7T55_15300, partial [Solirubrobacteraceae bacterium]|nr:hypothetical protein [Solirubrobacteraceae bacterium]
MTRRLLPSSTPNAREIRLVNTASRRRHTLVAGVAATAALLVAAPASQAAEVTNPADNPAPISVTIDGQTYTDGLDTLPGYDDHACTPIPNVEYDFPGNQVLYYDGSGDVIKTAKWTEWDRISSYKTWKDQQAKGSTSTPAPSATSAPSGPSSSSSSSSGSSSAPAGSGSAPAPAASAPAASAPASSGPAAATAPSGSTTTTSGSTTAPSATKSKTPKQDARR